MGEPIGTVIVKFEDPDIARICAETLNNHILDGQLLKTTLIDAKDNKDLKTRVVDKSDFKTFRFSNANDFKPKSSKFQNNDSDLQVVASLQQLKKMGRSFKYEL